MLKEEYDALMRIPDGLCVKDRNDNRVSVAIEKTNKTYVNSVYYTTLNEYEKLLYGESGNG